MKPHPDFVAAFEALRGPRSLTLDEFVQRFIDQREWDGDCLRWTGFVAPNGYGRVGVVGRKTGAHQVAYWMHTGQKPPAKGSGFSLDHLCRNRACVNPDHLELVTVRVNTERGTSPIASLAQATHCKHGHEWTPENTRITPRGHRDCRACARERWHRRKPMPLIQSDTRGAE